MNKYSIKRLLAAALCLCLLAGLYVPAAHADNADYDSMTFSQILAREENLTWVVAGDSITHNGSWSQGMNSYGEWLEQYLYTIGRKDSVVLSGWGGAKLEHYQPGYTGDVGMGTGNFITKFNPDVVTIKLGMNNRPTGEAEFKRMYNAMLDAVYSDCAKNGKTPKVVVLTSTPLAGENNYDINVPGQDSVYRQLGWLTSIVSEYNSKNGKHIQLVDLRNGFTNERDILGDAYYQTFFFGPSDGAIHPNAAGQYLIFKTIAKTLGFYDESMPIFRQNYEDLNEGYLYVDSTAISNYKGEYGSTVADSGELDKTMPVLETATVKLIASIDFTDKNGTFAGGATYAGATRVDMTDPEVMDDALTLEEAKALKTEFSVVFRARLDPSNQANQPVLFVSANGTANWGNAIALGVQGKSDQMYYEIRSNSSDLSNSSNTFSIDSTKTAVNGGWHTIALVQGAEDFRYYVDGNLVATKTYKLNSGKTIGSVFANAANFVAHIGSYSENAGTYQLDGDLDFYQLYNGALSADDVAYLAQNAGALVDADEMNRTMPTVEGAAPLSSIEFNSTNGYFDGNNTNLVDLTDANAVADPLTFAEASALQKSFSVVLRGRLEKGGNANAGILLISDNGVAKWNDALTVGIPSKNNQGWLRLMDGGAQKVSPHGQLNFAGSTPSGDGKWHTIVVTVSDNTYCYYLDNALVDTRTLTFTAGIGEVLTNEAAFAARFGRYSDGDGGSYTLKGDLDYFQFYGQTLTAAQVAQISGTYNSLQMNASMPTLQNTVVDVPNLLASVDFSSANGNLDFGNSEGLRIDTAAEGYVMDPLTQAEAASLDREFSVVIRARLENPYKENQPILFISSNGTDNWNNALVLGAPAKAETSGGTSYNNQIYYGINANNATATQKFGKSYYGGDAVTGQWHTLAFIISDGKITFYVDGVERGSAEGFGLKEGYTSIGSLFANSTDFAAQIGRYGIVEDGTSYKLKGAFDFWQFYDGALTASQVASLSQQTGGSVVSANWGAIDTDNSTWAIAGSQQLMGFEGTAPNRSLLRLIENTARNCSGWTNRDIRIIPVAAKGYTPEYLAANYDALFGGRNYNVFMLLPEVPAVYGSYTHSTEAVAAYEAAVRTLLSKNSGKTVVLWTPLASSNAAVNGYITDYANAIRKIASENSSVLFFDANKFMNEKMGANASLKTNWFEEGQHISPLCAMDLTLAFYNHAAVSAFTMSELKNHNLRLSGDTRSLKTYVRDYIAPTISVSDGVMTVDASAIRAAYPNITNLRVAILENVGIGDRFDGNWDHYAEFGNNSTTKLTIPWNNPVVTVYGEVGEYTYRFKDQTVAAAASTNTTDTSYTFYLEDLEVVGAPAIGFAADKTGYDVELYQYQREVRIRYRGGDNLKVTVNGKTVKAGGLSQPISVDSSAAVTVQVTGGAEDKTYTLNLTRPASPDIIITEVRQASSNSDLYDLVEIYNASGQELNLLDYALGYKKDYTDSVYTTENMGRFPYYFTGDDQAFNSRNGSTQTYTGINQITRNSSFWSGENVVEEPDYVAFPADSTVVLWVKYTNTKSATSTYETLVDSLMSSSTTYTLPDGTKIVPDMDMIALAERPNGEGASGASNTASGALPKAERGFHLENHGKLIDDGANNSTRSWLFVLKDTAVRDDNASVTEAGDDIISAAMFVRPTDAINMSTVLYYDVERGMSLVKNPVSYNATEAGAPYYSWQYGYANYTTFGAVEYWQKPADFGDTSSPAVNDQTPAGVLSGENAQISLSITDDQDIRYLELYVDADNDGTYETVLKKDITLLTSAANKGLAKDITSHEEKLDLGALTNAVKYYGFVQDGNGNKTTFGTAEAPKSIEIAQPGQLKINVSVTDESGEATEDKVTVSITLNQGDATVGIAGNYVVYNGEGQSVGTISNGSGVLTVANGETLVINNLPEGAGYTVKVTAPEGYEDQTDEAALTGKIGTDGVVNVSVVKKATSVKGDFTGDGVVDDVDVELLLWHYLFPDMNPLDGDGDLNGDGVVDDVDVELLLWHYLFPEENPL